MTGKRPRRRRDRVPLDKAWLRWNALHYVERYEATEQGVRRVLERRILRRCARTGESADEARTWIPEIIDKLVGLGYVDDRRFATGLVRRMRGAGHARARITARLREKGVPPTMIDEVWQEEEGPAELAAAWQAARRRRLGPYAIDPPTDRDARAKERRRQLAHLARRGFSFDVARQVVDAEEPPAELEL